jgi:MFS superfamily sulfate permease-like transporter
MLGGIFKKIPAPMLVLIIMIPLGIYLNFKSVYPGSLVVIGDFWKDVKWTPDFAAAGTYVFWKYVVMFLFVNSLESLLTVKALDGLDPFKRKSDYNQDLRALAVGNGVSGALGGLPMISEVARSSANVGFGGRTRWSNFFHGLFLLVSMLVLIPVIELIPNAALAAMLIFVAYRLANPKEFTGTYRIGPEQLVIFLTTIVVTVAEDLLMGVAAGILVKIIFHVINGAPLGSLFKAKYSVNETDKEYVIAVEGAAVFSNFLGYKKLWSTLNPEKNIRFDFSNAKLVDHSFMEQLHHFEEERLEHGSHVTLNGLEKFRPFSAHPLAARKLALTGQGKDTVRLDPRQVDLQNFAQENGYAFAPQKIRNAAKYRDFPIQKGNKILYEENTLIKAFDMGKVEIADMTLTEGARQAKSDTHITVLHIVDTRLAIPNFALEPEDLGTKFSELVLGKDIDFEGHPEFSKRYYLRGEDESAVRQFFTEKVIQFLEKSGSMHVESHDHSLLLYKKRDLLTNREIESAEQFAEDFVHIISEKVQSKV